MINKITAKLLRELSYRSGRYLIAPEFLSLLVTWQCNFRCLSCSIWEKTPSKELEKSDWEKIIANLAKTLKPETFVEINGGEPLIKKDLTIFLIRELKKHFSRVALNSNGSLINEEILDNLKEAGLDLIKISLYSLNEITHDSLRGHPDAYTQAKKAIELINKKGLNLEVGILLTAQNIKEAPELIQYLQTLPRTSVILQPLDEKVEDPEAKNNISTKLINELWPKKEDVENFFAWVLKNNQSIKNSPQNIKAIEKYYLNPENILRYRCFAGQRNLVVYPNGETALCFKGGIIGNVLKQDLKKILKNAGAERMRIKNCRKYCRIVGCNFSLGLKEFLENKLFGQ